MLGFNVCCCRFTWSAIYALAAAMVPVVYNNAMAADALTALASGFSYDRYGAKTLVVLPIRRFWWCYSALYGQRHNGGH